MTQLALDFERAPGQAPEVLPFHVELVIRQLERAGDEWQTARMLGFESESDKRVLRAICRAARGHIISGQKGYKLTRLATAEEIARTVWLKNQGRDMWRHWIEIQRVAHAIVAGCRPSLEV